MNFKPPAEELIHITASLASQIAVLDVIQPYLPPEHASACTGVIHDLGKARELIELSTQNLLKKYPVDLDV